MTKIDRILAISFSLIFCFSIFTASAKANNYTLIINQVRGDECCDVGLSENLKNQIEKLNSLNLSANFAVRYDALTNEKFSSLLKNSPHQIGGYLEIIPPFANDAQVEYRGSDDNWYQAQNAYLIGYSQEERKQIIDTFMERFFETFGYYPQFTTAWQIDSWSLGYLKSKYQVRVHQITREQLGTDSYTLYGGPAHYPFWPTNNWAMIPQSTVNPTMPLVVRQTITDPVYNYGDQSNSYTSQPNDYLLRSDDINYFEHIFSQAHNQPHNSFSFALIGLENSMDKDSQTEYFRQLEFVAKQVKDGKTVITTAGNFENWYQQHYQPFSVYSGENQNNPQEQAWWIVASNYRVRLRLSNNQLFISDLRVYSPEFSDPYANHKASLLGWWIVPFVIDGSRLFTSTSDLTYFSLRNDYLIDREAEYGEPSQLLIKKGISAEKLQVVSENSSIKILDENNDALFIANNTQLCLSEEADNKQPAIINSLISDLVWHDANNHPCWGFEKVEPDENLACYQSFASDNCLSEQRIENHMLLFPELKESKISVAKSSFFISNQYALANRNPLRVVIIPKDEDGNIILSEDPIEVSTNPTVDKVTINQPNPENGMIFVDIEHDTPTKVIVTLTVDGQKINLKGFFVPDCKTNWQQCVTHPRQAWWFLRNWFDDKARLKQEQLDKEAIFVN